jgi:hypothetical protein
MTCKLGCLPLSVSLVLTVPASLVAGVLITGGKSLVYCTDAFGQAFKDPWMRAGASLIFLSAIFPVTQ